MATYQSAADLPGALHSVQQHAPECPLLIQDGGSQDGTLELLQQAEPRPDWRSEPDEGIYDAFHRMIDRVRTPYVYFLGADDRLRPEWRETAATLQDPHAITYSDVWMTHSKRAYCGELPPGALARTNLCQQAMFYPSALFQQHRFRTEFRLQADWEFNMWCAAQPGLRLQYHPGCVCDFNDHSGLSSTQYDQNFNRAYPALLKQYFGWGAFLRYGLIAALAHHSRPLRGLS